MLLSNWYEEDPRPLRCILPLIRRANRYVNSLAPLFFLGNSISLEWFICEFREESRMLHLWFILPDQIPLLLPLLQSLQQQRLLLHPHRKPPSQLEAQRQPLQLRRHQKQRHNRMVLKSPGFHHPCSILYSQLHLFYYFNFCFVAKKAKWFYLFFSCRKFFFFNIFP